MSLGSEDGKVFFWEPPNARLAKSGSFTAHASTVSISMKLADLSMADSLRRNPRGGIEDAQFTGLLDLMQNVTLSPTSDRWTWTLDGFSSDFLCCSIRL
ncbi:hypothetical protein Tco_1136358 [Tanacetum coccineum]